MVMITSNASPSMAPWGGIERFFGTNPLCYGIPTGEQFPDIILDMATSVVARGKIRLAGKQQRSIPMDWAITNEGERTTDPTKALEGLVLPFGGPKGYGLVLLIDVLSSILTGANFGPHVSSMSESKEQGVGHFFLVIRPDLFEPLESFKKRMNQMIIELKNVKTMKGVDRIYLPGEKEHEIAVKRRDEGIPLTSSLLDELRQVARKLEIKVENYLW
jgi:LDH2 family malate/lactate/ureidoglycolate dehydrogenase